MTATTPVAPPGTWLADVDRDQTLHIINLINLAVTGLDVVRNRILVGVDVAGDEPERIEDRVDYVRDAARESLRDLATVRDLIALATATIASAAVDTGAPYEDVCDWAAAEDDPRTLHALNDLLVSGVEPDLAALVHRLALRLARSSG